MARRRIGQERLGFVVGGSGGHSCLAGRVRLIGWVPVEHQLAVISCAVKGASRPGRRWRCSKRC